MISDCDCHSARSLPLRLGKTASCRHWRSARLRDAGSSPPRPGGRRRRRRPHGESLSKRSRSRCNCCVSAWELKQMVLHRVGEPSSSSPPRHRVLLVQEHCRRSRQRGQRTTRHCPRPPRDRSGAATCRNRSPYWPELDAHRFTSGKGRVGGRQERRISSIDLFWPPCCRTAALCSPPAQRSPTWSSRRCLPLQVSSPS